MVCRNTWRDLCNNGGIACVSGVCYSRGSPLERKLVAKRYRLVKRPMLALGLWLGISSGACAEWHVLQSVDRMTDEVTKFALADAKEKSSGIVGSLFVACDIASAEALHIRAPLYAAIQLSEKMPIGATISWRVDEQPVHHQHMPELRSTSMSAIHELSPLALTRAKRLRLQWIASNGTVLFYDFDLAGADQAISQIPCGKPSPSKVAH